jgi:hypothetical protein
MMEPRAECRFSKGVPGKQRVERRAADAEPDVLEELAA